MPRERGGDARHDALAQKDLAQKDLAQKDHDSDHDRPGNHLLANMRRGQRLRQHDGGTDQESGKMTPPRSIGGGLITES